MKREKTLLSTSLQKTNRVPQTMMNADTSTLTIRLRVRMLSLTLRGGFLITSPSTGSTPKLLNTWHDQLENLSPPVGAGEPVTLLYL